MAKSKRRGSIRERKDGRFEARATIDYKPDGTPIQRSAYGKTKAEAERAMTELQLKHDKGLLTDPNKMTVADCLDRHINSKANADEGTRYKARCEVRVLLELIGRKKLQDLRTPQVRDAYTALAVQGLSVRVQSRAAMHLRAALRDAVHEGIITRNVTEGVKVSTPRVDEEDEVAQAWTPREVSIFLEAAKNDPLYGIFYLMLATGLRRSEALGLPWKDIDFDRGTLKVIQAYSPKGNGASFVLKTVKTPHAAHFAGRACAPKSAPGRAGGGSSLPWYRLARERPGLHHIAGHAHLPSERAEVL
jgi:integrase